MNACNSSQTPHEIYWQLKQSNVALDSISLGDEDNSELQAASALLGCYRFYPESLENALTITEVRH